MAACEVLYFDATHVGRIRRDPLGTPLGEASDGWRPCPAQASRHLEVAGHLRDVCPDHQRQLTALTAAGLAGRVRWAWQPAG